MYHSLNQQKPIVQKYGGTSVGSVDRIRSIAHRIAKLHQQGHRKLALVVSAQSGETNRLVQLMHAIHPHPPAESYDMALAAGEQVSVALMTAALAREGLNAKPLLAYQLGIYTDELHARARIRQIDTSAIEKTWQDGGIAVVAGFQGITKENQLTTLGRGGSDTSAVALAVAVGAGFCEINTDVDGLYTGDPRYIPEARLMETVDYEVALEMASLGSKVLHPRCVELGYKYKMPLVVRNSFKSDDSRRTTIMVGDVNTQLEAPVVTGVSQDRDVLSVTLDGIPNQPHLIAEIFDVIGEESVNVDIIVVNRDEGADTMRLGFTVAEADLNPLQKALNTLQERSEFSTMKVTMQDGLAKVSVVGVGMRSHSGVAKRAFRALADKAIDVAMVSTSEIKISCVVNREQGEAAAQAWHREFFSEEA